MSILGLWKFIKQKLFDPVQKHERSDPTPTGPLRRLDLLGSLYPIIRNAYTFHPVEVAHGIVEKAIRRLVNPTNSVVYIDGAPSAEKQGTHQNRKSTREKAVAKGQQELKKLEQRVQSDSRPRKQQFLSVEKSIRQSFLWLPSARDSLAGYLESKNYTVVVCPTEADVQIARDCQPTDVVISGDSDLLLYSKINTVWRPMRRNQLLCYDVEQVVKTLGISKQQLMALGIVSRNDYTRNIPSLGCATNYGVIKNLKDQDVETLVKAYLSDERVVAKNTKEETFNTSIRVFLKELQTPLPPLDDSSLPSKELMDAYSRVKRQYAEKHVAIQENTERRKRTIDTPPDRSQPAPAMTAPESLPATSSDPPATETEVHTASQMSTSTDLPADTPMASQSSVSVDPLADTFMASQSSSTSVDPLADALMASQSSIDPLPTDTTTQESQTALSATHKAQPRREGNCFWPRYSHRDRTRKIVHEKPECFKQYAWKPWKVAPTTPQASASTAPQASALTPQKPKPRPRGQGTASEGENMSKVSLYRRMGRQHPFATLRIGTLKANVHRAPRTHNDTELEAEVMKCLREVTHHAADTKRAFQRLVGQFIECIMKPEGLKEGDRDILDLLCPRVVVAELNQDQPEGDTMEPDEDPTKEDNSDQAQFIKSMLLFIWNGKTPYGKLQDNLVKFINRIQELGLWEQQVVEAWAKAREYPGSSFLSSVSQQLCLEFKGIYRRGTLEMTKQLETKKKKGVLSDKTDIAIDDNVSAIENFIRLNRLNNNRRKIVSLTGNKNPMITISESDLLQLLLKSTKIKTSLEKMVRESENMESKAKVTRQKIETWLGGVPPGTVVSALITDTGNEVKAMRRPGIGKSFCNVTKTMSLQDMSDHIARLQATGFDPNSYSERGYVMTGSIRTNGFKLQVIAWKIRELQSVRYRRLPQELLPPRITSQVGGTDYFMSEIRNVIKTPQDVQDIWGCPAKDIAIIGIDLGQAYVVGASALLPDSGDQGGEASPKVYHNLSVNQKAVYQPTFKYRDWLNKVKNKPLSESGPSITEIESSMPPLRGDSASLTEYVEYRAEFEQQLTNFYSPDGKASKNAWDAERAREAEYSLITERLLNMVGGSAGRLRRPEQKVAIGIGLSRFSSHIRLSSLDSSFTSYFVQKVRSLGYIVIGVNEYYTSKRCPECHQFVGQMEIRRLYCSNCKVKFHRDVMAGENIANIVQSYLVHQRRPLYLQPYDADGNYPWELTATSSSSDQASSSTSGNQEKGISKRAASAVLEKEPVKHQ
ncbi:MAG: hypothetical protein J3Q66DRAFT_391248 [Benniella sp.]|nr:MAG: hypothetical protein J3Q66DRAFT_391248 [Benniella sp.]